MTVILGHQNLLSARMNVLQGCQPDYPLYLQIQHFSVSAAIELTFQVFSTDGLPLPKSPGPCLHLIECQYQNSVSIPGVSSDIMDYRAFLELFPTMLEIFHNRICYL